MSTLGTPGGASQLAGPGKERAQAPIRWPHPDRTGVALAGLWLVGLLTALAVPALIVMPGDMNASQGHVWLAFACTVVGAVVMIGASWALFHHRRDFALAVWGFVPSLTVLGGGAIMTATHLTGG